MQEPPPVLSIIIPVYNRTECLSACVDSVRRQTFENMEILLVDDYSDEETAVFLQLFTMDDPRVRVLSNTGKKGANACRNLGLRESRGEYIIFLDSDDILCRFCAQLRINDMNAAPDLDFIAYPCLMFQAKPLDRLIIWNIKNETALLDRFLQHDAPFQTTGPIWRRSRIAGRLRWDEDMPGWQDWKFHVEALLLGLKGEFNTRIDYFWNAPKQNSITRTSHTAEGRLLRMKGIVKLAQSVPEAHRPAILSSVVSLGVRMARKDRLGAARSVYSVLKGRPGALHVACFMLLERCRAVPLVLLRGYFRKRVERHYPLARTILRDSRTYKLLVPMPQLRQLVTLLHENSHRS